MLSGEQAVDGVGLLHVISSDEKHSNALVPAQKSPEAYKYSRASFITMVYLTNMSFLTDVYFPAVNL